MGITQSRWRERINQNLFWLNDRAGWDSFWYESPFGFILVYFYTAVALALCLITTNEVQAWLEIDLTPVGIPIGLYAAGALGAFGYLFTRLFIAHGDKASESDDSIMTITLFRIGLTVIGSLPLVFGVYVLADQLNVDSIGIVAAAFLTGMFVKTIYGIFGDIADRLSSNPTNDQNAANASVDSNGDDGK